MALNYTNPGWTNDEEPYIDADNLNDISDNLEEATELIGNETMDTTATTITGAIKELVGRIGSTVIGTVSTTITSAIKAIQDKLKIVNYNDTNKTFSIFYDDGNRFVLNKENSEIDQYGLLLAQVAGSYLSANSTLGSGTYKVNETSSGDSASLQLNPVSGNVSLFHNDGGDGGYRVLLNNTKGGRHAMFRVDVGDDTSMLLNKALGTLDIRLDGTTRKNRLLICSGKGTDPQSMVLRCGESYVERPANMNRLNLVAGDGAYITIGGDTTAPRIFIVAGGTTPNADAGVYINGTRFLNTPATSVTRLARGEVHVDMNGSNNRLTLTCSGGLVVNGYLGATTTFKDQSGRTVTVKNGIITSVS